MMGHTVARLPGWWLAVGSTTNPDQPTLEETNQTNVNLIMRSFENP